MTDARAPLVVALDSVTLADVPRVGGKNASLGELIRRLSAAGVRVVGGFATTVAAYRAFVEANALEPEIGRIMRDYQERRLPLARAGREIRERFSRAELPTDVARAVAAAYGELRSREPAERSRSPFARARRPRICPRRASRANRRRFSTCAVKTRCSRRAGAASPRSTRTPRSATARTTASTSSGSRCRSACKPMVRSDRGAAGVMFSIDTETGFPGVVVISGAGGSAKRSCKAASSRTSIASSSRYSARKAAGPSSSGDAGASSESSSTAPPHADASRQDAPFRAGRLRALGRRTARARALGRPDRGALRQAHGHGVGEGRPHGRALRAASETGDGPGPPRHGRAQDIHAPGERGAACCPAPPSAMPWRRGACAASEAPRKSRASSRAVCS